MTIAPTRLQSSRPTLTGARTAAAPDAHAPGRRAAAEVCTRCGLRPPAVARGVCESCGVLLEDIAADADREER